MTAQFRLIMLLQYLETGWIWLYTAGMRGEDAQGRRDELASDAWEHLKYARTRRENAFVQVLGRFVRGMPDDMSWRGGRGLSGFSRASLGEACVAALIGDQ